MDKFFESNPGLKSRFNTFIEFSDYSAEELMNILNRMCTENDYILSDELVDRITQYMSSETEKKEENFANGRLARNIYEKLIMNHARRIANSQDASKEELSLLIDTDFSC